MAEIKIAHMVKAALRGAIRAGLPPVPARAQGSPVLEFLKSLVMRPNPGNPLHLQVRPGLRIGLPAAAGAAALAPGMVNAPAPPPGHAPVPLRGPAAAPAAAPDPRDLLDQQFAIMQRLADGQPPPPGADPVMVDQLHRELEQGIAAVRGDEDWARQQRQAARFQREGVAPLEQRRQGNEPFPAKQAPPQRSPQPGGVGAPPGSPISPWLLAPAILGTLGAGVGGIGGLWDSRPGHRLLDTWRGLGTGGLAGIGAGLGGVGGYHFAKALSGGHAPAHGTGRAIVSGAGLGGVGGLLLGQALLGTAEGDLEKEQAKRDAEQAKRDEDAMLTRHKSRPTKAPPQ